MLYKYVFLYTTGSEYVSYLRSLAALTVKLSEDSAATRAMIKVVFIILFSRNKTREIFDEKIEASQNAATIYMLVPTKILFKRGKFRSTNTGNLLRKRKGARTNRSEEFYLCQAVEEALDLRRLLSCGFWCITLAC
jgi:hypothetical protein